MRAGDLVEVRGAAEILATLDDRGLLRGLPFMPEMIPMLGQRFVVRARVGRACDTIGYTGPRRIPDSVILDDLRCDGGGHDGCGAHCVLYWNEAWLREVGGGAEPEVGHSTGDVEDLRRLVVSSSVDTEAGGPKIYRCQATEFLRASVPEPSWGIASFSRELTSGNVRLLPFLRVLASATYATALTTGSNGLRRGISAVGLSGVTRRVRLAKEARRQPLERTEVRKPSTPDAPATFLEPGQLLKIRPLHEIESQLDERNKTRGLYFDGRRWPLTAGARRECSAVSPGSSTRRAERWSSSRVTAMSWRVSFVRECAAAVGGSVRGRFPHGGVAAG